MIFLKINSWFFLEINSSFFLKINSEVSNKYCSLFTSFCKLSRCFLNFEKKCIFNTINSYFRSFIVEYSYCPVQASKEFSLLVRFDHQLWNLNFRIGINIFWLKIGSSRLLNIFIYLFLFSREINPFTNLDNKLKYHRYFSIDDAWLLFLTIGIWKYKSFGLKAPACE